MLALESHKVMTRGKSSGECWETIGVEDPRIKCDDAKDHRIKGGPNCSSHKQPTGREDKDFAPSAEEARRQC